jgi:hypothetical protein
MNRFERTHEELKKQLEQLGIYDNLNTAQENPKIPQPEESFESMLDNQREAEAELEGPYTV